MMNKQKQIPSKKFRTTPVVTKPPQTAPLVTTPSLTKHAKHSERASASPINMVKDKGSDILKPGNTSNISSGKKKTDSDKSNVNSITESPNKGHSDTQDKNVITTEQTKDSITESVDENRKSQIKITPPDHSNRVIQSGPATSPIRFLSTTVKPRPSSSTSSQPLTTTAEVTTTTTEQQAEETPYGVESESELLPAYIPPDDDIRMYLFDSEIRVSNFSKSYPFSILASNLAKSD